MHEFSIGGRIVDAVRAEFARLEPPADRLLAVRVVIGRLHQVVPDYLVFAYETLCRDSTLEGSKLELDFRPVVGRCGDCGWQGEIEPPFFRCAGCESLDIETVAGDEFYLAHLEVETDDGSGADDPPPAGGAA